MLFWLIAVATFCLRAAPVRNTEATPWLVLLFSVIKRRGPQQIATFKTRCASGLTLADRLLDGIFLGVLWPAGCLPTFLLLPTDLLPLGQRVRAF